MISNLKSDYPNLRNSSRWINMSNDLKTAMKEIINNYSNKTYDNFYDFNDAFIDWYKYTVSIR